jgi:hypothetical protein
MRVETRLSLKKSNKVSSEAAIYTAGLEQNHACVKLTDPSQCMYIQSQIYGLPTGVIS